MKTTLIPLPSLFAEAESMFATSQAQAGGMAGGDEAMRSFQRLASGVDPAHSSSQIGSHGFASSHSMDFQRPNWMSVQVPRTDSQDFSGPNRANNLWSTHSVHHSIRDEGYNNNFLSQPSGTGTHRSLMTVASTQMDHNLRPTSHRSLMTTDNGPMSQPGFSPLNTSVSQAYPTPRHLLSTTQNVKEKSKSKGFFRTKNLRRLFSKSSKKEEKLDQPMKYSGRTLETGISEALESYRQLPVGGGRWANNLDSQASIMHSQALSALSMRPSQSSIKKSNSGRKPCEMVWEYAAVRKAAQNPSEAVRILKHLLAQARSKSSVAAEVFNEITALTGERDQWHRLSGWELLYLFVLSVPSVDLGKISFPGPESGPKTSLAGEITAASQKVERVLTIVNNYGPRKQVPTKEEIQAFVMGKQASTSVRLVNGSKVEMPFDIHDTVRNCVPKLAKKLHLSTHTSFSLFLSNLDKSVPEVMVKPDAHMGDVVEALRQGLLQGMNVELLVKRMYFGRNDDYKRDEVFAELTFLQVKADYLEGKYPLKMAEAAYLTALCLHSDHANHAPLMQKAEDASPLIRNHSPPEAAKFGLDWHKEVVVVYGCLMGLTKHEAQRQFLTLLSKKAYGLCVFFRAQPLQGKTKKPAITLGFNSKGLHLFSENPITLTESIPLSKILHYGLYENSIMLEVKRGSNIAAVHFSTHEGQRMCTVLQHYFNEALARLKDKKKSPQTVEEKLQSVASQLQSSSIQTKRAYASPLASREHSREQAKELLPLEFNPRPDVPDTVFTQPPPIKTAKSGSKQGKRSKSQSSNALLISTFLLDTVYSQEGNDSDQKAFKISSARGQSPQPPENQKAGEGPEQNEPASTKEAECLESSQSKLSKSADSILPAASSMQSLSSADKTAHAQAPMQRKSPRAAEAPQSQSTGSEGEPVAKMSVIYESQEVSPKTPTEVAPKQSAFSDSSASDSDSNSHPLSRRAEQIGEAVCYEDAPFEAAPVQAPEATGLRVEFEYESGSPAESVHQTAEVEFESEPRSMPGSPQAKLDASEEVGEPQAEPDAKSNQPAQIERPASAPRTPEQHQQGRPRPALSKVQQMIQRLNKTEAVVSPKAELPRRQSITKPAKEAGSSISQRVKLFSGPSPAMSLSPRGSSTLSTPVFRAASAPATTAPKALDKMHQEAGIESSKSETLPLPDQPSIDYPTLEPQVFEADQLQSIVAPKPQNPADREPTKETRSGSPKPLKLLFTIKEDDAAIKAEAEMLKLQLTEAKRAKEEADVRVSHLERMASEAHERSARELVTRAQEMIEAKEENSRLKQLLSASMRASDLTTKKEGEDDQGHLKALTPEQLQSMAAKSWNLAVKLNSAHEEIATLQTALASAIKQTSAMGTAISPEVRMDLLRTSHLLETIYDDVAEPKFESPKHSKQSQKPVQKPVEHSGEAALSTKSEKWVDSAAVKNADQVYSNKLYETEDDVEIILETCPGFFEEELIE